MNCFSTTRCKAVGDGVIASLDGATWTNDPSPTGNSLTGVSCPTTTQCIAVGTGTTILSTGPGTILNAAPTATSVQVMGNAYVGQTLTCSYAYNDAEGDTESGTTFRWLRGASQVGTNQTYLTVVADAGQTLTCEVTPRAATGTVQGAAATSPGVLINAVPPGSTLIVNSLADTNDGACNVLGQGGGNQDCTLREAINAANTFIGTDTITFSVSGTITLGSILPAISDDATIDGSGQTVTVSGNNSVQFTSVGGGKTLTLRQLTFDRPSAFNADGGGINNAGTLNLFSVTFSNAFISFGNGAAIYNSGTLNITDSIFSSNRNNGGPSGGAIYNSGTLTIVRSLFTGNRNTPGGGGAIWSSVPVTITDSTFSNNQADTGGAVQGRGTITGSTFSGNTATWVEPFSVPQPWPTARSSAIGPEAEPAIRPGRGRHLRQPALDGPQQHLLGEIMTTARAVAPTSTSRGTRH